jgi:hypothetical protein
VVTLSAAACCSSKCLASLQLCVFYVCLRNDRETVAAAVAVAVVTVRYVFEATLNRTRDVLLTMREHEYTS